MDACFAGEVEYAFKHEVIVKDFWRTEKTQYLPVPSGEALYSDMDVSAYYNSVLVPRKTQWFIVSGMGPVPDGKQPSPFAKKLIDVLTRSAIPVLGPSIFPSTKSDDAGKNLLSFTRFDFPPITETSKLNAPPVILIQLAATAESSSCWYKNKYSGYMSSIQLNSVAPLLKTGLSALK